MKCKCGTETIESYAGGSTFQYCKSCKIEVLPLQRPCSNVFKENHSCDIARGSSPKILNTFKDDVMSLRFNSLTVGLPAIYVAAPITKNFEIGQQIEITSINKATGEMTIRRIYGGKS
jgi:hypothetical protein